MEKKVNKKNKLWKPTQEFLNEAKISLIFEPAFKKWCEDKDIQVSKVLNSLIESAESEKLRLNEAQARHMVVIEKFLQIQTSIFQRLEKRLK